MTRKHDWQLDSEGEVDTFVLDYEFHNGPFCETCLASFCVHCTPDWAETECEGDDDTD